MNDTESSIFNELPMDDEVAGHARAVFGEACVHVHARRARELRLARQRALGAVPRRRHAPAWVPLAGGAVACVALAIGAMWMHPTGPRHQGVAPMPATGHTADTGGLPDVDSNQMDIAQDLDFYRWLASQPKVATANRSHR